MLKNCNFKLNPFFYISQNQKYVKAGIKFKITTKTIATTNPINEVGSASYGCF